MKSTVPDKEIHQRRHGQRLCKKTVSHTTARLDYHHQWQGTPRVSLPFITTVPGTDLAGTNDIKLLNWSGPDF